MKNKFLYIFGYADTLSSLLIRTITNAVVLSDFIIPGPVAFTPVTTDYNLAVETPNTTSISNLQLTTTSVVTFMDTVLIENINSSGDISFYLNYKHFGDFEGNKAHTISLYLTCSISGNTAITYSIPNNLRNLAPSWISLNETSQTIEIFPPKVENSQNFIFEIIAEISGRAFKRVISLTIIPEVETSDITNFFTVNSQKIAGSIVATTLVFSSVNSIVSTSSIQGFWSLINQFQFYILIPLLTTYIPDNIVKLIEGLDFSLLNFNFFDLKQLREKVDEVFECKIENDYLYSIGIVSKCSIPNNLKIILFLILMMILH